ncbi:MAG TPA: DUF885 family protein [Rhizomicrobium sp.]|jgi:uncharacterized protein (DUF885 family)
MLDRRTVLLSGAATVAAGSVIAKAAPDAPAASDPAALDALFDKFVDEGLDLSPEGCTSLGLDTGKRYYEKSLLTDRSLAGNAKQKAQNTSQLQRLNAIDRASLNGMDGINYDIIHFNLQTTEDANKRYAYGGTGAGQPYYVSQFGGAYSQIPDFLDSQHTIATKEDADAYLARLAAFATAIDQEIEVMNHDAGLGVIPPDFIIAATLKQLKTLRAMTPDQAVLVQSVVRRTKEKNIPGDWDRQASTILTGKVYPALDRQIALLNTWLPKATHDAGVWRLPDGDQYYVDSVLNWTTSTMKPSEIHQLGLDLVKQYTARIDGIMKTQGLTKGTVGERLRGMFENPKFIYPNTDEGKAKLIADLNDKVKAVTAKLPGYFGTLPKAKLEIRRIPKYTESSQAGGYYQPGSLDGKRPGAYYINLRDTKEQPSWLLGTLTYHEGIPGHHLQLSLQQEASLPTIRKISFFSAYIEGWALYAEQLADEMGMYANDPFGQIGYLHDAMFRAVRLVVDSGMHAMKWTREEAITYYADTIGDPVSSATTEVERYCAWPGQACGYMLGKVTWLTERERAKTALGAKFDIRKFHDAGLLSGAMSLTVLHTVIGNYIDQTAKV